MGGRRRSCRATATSGRASARRTRPGRCRPGSRRRRGNFDTAFKAAAKTVSASFMYPYNGHTPLGPGGCRRRLPDAGGPDKDTRHDLQQHAERRQHRRRARCSDRWGSTSPKPGAQHLLRGLELVRQRLPLPRHRRGGRGAVACGRQAGAAPADALGRAGLEQVRPRDHAPTSGPAIDANGQHHRVRGDRVRAGEQPASARDQASCSARSRQLRAPGHERREPARRCTRSPRTRSAARAIA